MEEREGGVGRGEEGAGPGGEDEGEARRVFLGVREEGEEEEVRWGFHRGC